VNKRISLGVGLIIVSAGVALLIRVGVDDGGASPTPVDAGTATHQIVAALDALLAGGPLRIEAAGGAGAASKPTTFRGEVDRAGQRGRWTETTPTESGSDVIAETTVADGVTYSRIYASTEPPPAYSPVADAIAAARTLDSSLTVAGQLTDSLTRVRQIVEAIPFRALDLGSRTRSGRRAHGTSVDFATADVYNWLISTGYETVDGAAPSAGSVTMQFWIADGVLVGFGTRNDNFHDGELLHHVHFDVDYTLIPSVDVSAP
jgi:hypothetical protein